MFSEEFLKIAPSDQSEFGSVINYLLLKGFVVRDIFDPKEKVMRTSEYYRYIENDSILGVVALSNFYSENRTKIDRETSLILFVLRLIYENEKDESNSSTQAIYITTPGLIQVMIQDGITMPGKRLYGRGIAKSLRFLANHNIISKVSGSYDEGNVSFYILPSVCYALDGDKIKAMSQALDELNRKNESEGGLLDETSN